MPRYYVVPRKYGFLKKQRYDVDQEGMCNACERMDAKRLKSFEDREEAVAYVSFLYGQEFQKELK